MKQQIARFSPHQNGKVFAALAAVGCLVFFVPMFLIMVLFSPAEQRPPVIALLLVPVFYLVFGYVMVAIGCVVYNFMFKYVGGIEIDLKQQGD